MTEPLHLVRLVLDRRALARVASRHRLPRDLDDGYLIHAGLAQLFAASREPAAVPLRTFAVDDVYAAARGEPGLLYLLGYAGEPDTALTQRMGEVRHDLLRVCKSRELPGFARGQRLGFRARVCPVVRTKIPGRDEARVDKRGKVRSREVDAFVHATLGVSQETRVSREEVYVRWLRTQLETAGACTLETAGLVEFRREVMHRHGGGAIERPNAVVEGVLTVADPIAFDALLRRGLGRHRAFGFGMLLLKPAAR